jgi:hypothetical protein
VGFRSDPNPDLPRQGGGLAEITSAGVSWVPEITKGSGFATVTTAGQEQSQEGNDQDLLNDLHDYLAPAHRGQAQLHPEKIPDHTNAFDDTCESGQSRTLQSGQGSKCSDWVNASKSTAVILA